MLKINRINDNAVKERNRRQRLEEQLARQEANLDYVEMMSNIDIPVENTQEGGGSDAVTKI